MEQYLTYNEAGTCTDSAALLEYCLDAMIDAAEKHNGPFDNWVDGWHVVDSYLDHNKAIDKETREVIGIFITQWLENHLDRATPVQARRYEIDDRRILIRKEAAPSERYYWCHPLDGSAHGGGITDKYVRFVRRKDAESDARTFGYEVVKE